MATPELLDPLAAASPRLVPSEQTRPVLRMTAEEYLTWESDPAREGERKSEYYHGEVIEMPGVTLEHVEITENISHVVKTALDRDQYFYANGDLKIGIGAGLFLYSDGAIVRRPPQLREDTDRVLLNPLVVFEVLFPSTKVRDKTDKYDGYTSLESLRHYVLVHQDSRLLECHTHRDGHWDYEGVAGDKTLRLEAVDLDLPLAEVYRNVPLPAEQGDV